LQREVEVEDAIALAGLNRRLRTSLPEEVFALGFSRWKRRFLPDFLTGSAVRFVENVDQVPRGASLLVWGRNPVADKREDLALLRMEDGFLRSSGLGADLVQPFSLVIDDLGIYYDATRPSRLERILAERAFTDDERARGKALRKAIVAAGVNKYNLGGSAWQRPQGGARVILVVGQVEADASIALGSPDLRSNLALLERVRAENPDAHILYKPHPDVVAGLREPGSDEARAAAIADEVLADADPNHLLGEIDELHTMTSLLGFEALLRGVPVTCHGLPFYAGWGLTSDRIACPRRGRRVALDELAFAALALYPRYFSPRGGLFAEPEQILEELAAARPQTRPLHRKLLRLAIVGWRRLAGKK